MLGLSDEIASAPTEQDVEPPDYEIWEENIPTLNLFLSLKNQWDMIISPDGEVIRTGIKTQAIEFKLKYQNGIPKKDYTKLVQQIEWMEDAALKVMNEARAERIRRKAEQMENK